MTKKLLIVDDEEIVCDSLKRCLAVLGGYEVTTATNSTGAFRLIEEFNPDILLLDLHLPQGLNGIQILERLRQTNPDLKVVMMTGFGEEENIADECLRLGAVKFLYKPLKVADIKRQLDQL